MGMRAVGSSDGSYTKKTIPLSGVGKWLPRVRPYRELVGTLSWPAPGTRSDIAFVTSSVAHYGHNPGCVYCEVTKCVLHYLKGSKGSWRPLCFSYEVFRRRSEPSLPL
jgi:hypothetical protein